MCGAPGGATEKQTLLEAAFEQLLHDKLELCAGGGPGQQTARAHRFSAFWLRSSVVSVLISLISDTSSIRGLHIKWIFCTGSRKRGLPRSLHASARHCSAAGNGAPLSLTCGKAITESGRAQCAVCHRTTGRESKRAAVFMARESGKKLSRRRRCC